MPHNQIGVPSTIQDSTQINRAKEVIQLQGELNDLNREIEALKKIRDKLKGD
jgi:hypothetical protein